MNLQNYRLEPNPLSPGDWIVFGDIYDDQGKLLAGLSISAPADRLDEAWLTKLQSTAEAISQALGYKE